MSRERLSRRALNRATLSRQLLLQRAGMGAAEAIEHLVGMQAQAPNAPYVGLWARLEGFDPDELARLLVERRAVRAPLMRATIHLVTSPDCLALRPLVQPVLERSFHTGSPFGRQALGLDLDAVLAAGRSLLAEQPRTRAELGPLLAERWPDQDVDTLAYVLTYLEPLVQVPPRGVWGSSGPAAWTTVDAWLGSSSAVDGDASTVGRTMARSARGHPGRPGDVRVGAEVELDVDGLVLRYLAAFGPASVADAQVWSGLTRLAEVVDRLRPRLRTFEDEDSRELFDLPDAPRPDPDTPAPARFLPEYDNVQFGHADRRRIVPPGRRPPLFPGNGATLGTVLVDGMLRGTWKLSRRRTPGREVEAPEATLTIEPYEALGDAEHDALVDEGTRLLTFVAGDAATQRVRVQPSNRSDVT